MASQHKGPEKMISDTEALKKIVIIFKMAALFGIHFGNSSACLAFCKDVSIF